MRAAFSDYLHIENILGITLLPQNINLSKKKNDATDSFKISYKIMDWIGKIMLIFCSLRF